MDMVDYGCDVMHNMTQLLFEHLSICIFITKFGDNVDDKIP
jgi:hypothetical protein